MKKTFLAVSFAAFAILLTSGCTSTRVSQSLASGVVGCSPKEIEIEDETVYRNVHNFTAVCRGVKHVCTYMYPNPISCKEQAEDKAKAQ